MLGLLVLFAVVLLVLVVALWAGTLGLQGLIYTEPAPQLQWRAPAAAAALTLLMALWCFLAYVLFDPTNPNQVALDTLFRFQTRQTVSVPKFWSVKNDQETLFERRDSGTSSAPEYRDKLGKPWSRADTSGIVKAIIIEENGERVTFKPQLNRDGTFVQTRESFAPYYEVGGRRVMDEHVGQMTYTHRSLWLLNIFFNLLFFALWFACLWLLLRFQLPHAVGLAVVVGVAMSLLILPLLLDRTREVAKQRLVYTAPVSQLQDPIGPDAVAAALGRSVRRCRL